MLLFFSIVGELWSCEIVLSVDKVIDHISFGVITSY